MSTESKFDELAGKAKEAGGKLTGDKHLETEGKADQVQAKVQETVDKAKDAAQGVADSLKKD